MKPSKIRTDNANHLSRLEQIMGSSDYIAEEKIDGCHYLCIGGRFFSTRISETTGWPVEKTDVLSHLSKVIAPLGKKLILDGEVYYPGGKSQDVITVTGSYPEEALRKQMQQGFVRYIVFDCLRDPEGNWMINRPWMERRVILEQLQPVFSASETHVDIIPIVRSGKQELLNSLISSGKEGIVLKNVHGLYEPGKRPMWNWIKIKQEDEDDVVIIGFEQATRVYTGKDMESWPYWEDDTATGESVPVTRLWANGWIGAIIFGKYEGHSGVLTRLGTCSGIDDATRQEFSNNPDAYIGKVMRIKCMEMTRDGAYRHPNYVALHPDKNPRECIIDR